jgi:hypothetical protein
MAMASTESLRFTLTLTEEERAQLLSLLEQARRDAHVEARRTENPDYQERIHHQETVLKGLIDKLRQP